MSALMVEALATSKEDLGRLHDRREVGFAHINKHNRPRSLDEDSSIADMTEQDERPRAMLILDSSRVAGCVMASATPTT